jgi:hypothetical protein
MVACLWPASGEALSFSLNCIITGNNTCTPSVSYGTISFTDNGNGVDVQVDLVGTGQRIQTVLFNYDDAQFSNDAFSIAPSVGVAENGKTLPPFNGGGFDLQIPSKANMNTPDPYLGTLTLASVNLDPSDFNFKDSSGILFAAVHIGTCGPNAPASCLPGQIGEDSIKVGALDPLAPVPEPATLLLWGTTVAGLGFLKRRRHRARD